MVSQKKKRTPRTAVYGTKTKMARIPHMLSAQTIGELMFSLEAIVEDWSGRGMTQQGQRMLEELVEVVEPLRPWMEEKNAGA